MCFSLCQTGAGLIFKLSPATDWSFIISNANISHIIHSRFRKKEKKLLSLLIVNRETTIVNKLFYISVAFALLYRKERKEHRDHTHN